MTVLLPFRRSDTVRVAAIGIRSIGGVEIGEPVTVVFAKAEQGKLYTDDGGTYRWITVHPHGEDEPGTPVKIRESKTEPGTWHVVGGAGGHLNYLRITGVKSPAEYRKQAIERRARREQMKRAKSEQEAARHAGMTEEERGAEAVAKTERAAKLEAAKKQQREEEQKFIERVAKGQGWSDDEWQFDSKKLEAAGASKKRVLQLEADFHKRILARARAVLNQSKNVLIAKGAEQLHGAPLHSDDPDKIALDDVLDGPTIPRGKGFVSPTRKLSDEEVREQGMQADRQKLQREAKALQADLARQADDGTVDPNTRAALAEVQGELKLQALIEEASRTTPADRQKERTQVDADLKATLRRVAAQQGTPEMRELTDKLSRGEPLSSAEQTKAGKLETDIKHADQLRERQSDLDVMDQGSAAPVIKPEAQAVIIQKREQRAAEIAKEQGPEAADAYKARIEHMQRALQRYRNEIKLYKETGILKRPSELKTKAVSDPDEVLHLLAADKSLKRRGRAIAEAGEKDEELDQRLYGKPAFTETGTVDPATLKAVKQEIDKAVETTLTQSFLEKAESPELLLGHGGQFREHYDQHDLHSALEKHLGAGAYNAINNAALAMLKDGVLSREVVDVLGPKASAQLLARAITEREGRAVAAKLADKLGEYHVQQDVLQAGDRLREVEESLNDADQAMKQVTNPSDLALAMHANRERAAKLEEARETAGQALGEYEATAALVDSLGKKSPDELFVNMGPIGPEAAVRQLRALGLDKTDYKITGDGTNHFATIQKSGFDKLIQKPDPAKAKLTEEVLAIKRGERDDPKWSPRGAAKRASTTFRAEGLQPPPLRKDAPAFNTMTRPEQLEEHIARRVADGEDVNDILPDVFAHLQDAPVSHRQALVTALGKLFPTSRPTVDKEGKPVYVHDPKTGAAKLDEQGQPIPSMHTPKAEDFRADAQRLVERYLGQQGHDKFAPIHAQQLDLDSAEGQEAIVRAVTPDPRTLVAFHPIGELTSQDQRALRSYFASEIAKPGAAHAALDAALKTLGPEPERTQKAGGLFGGEITSPDWLNWKHRHDKILEDHHFKPGEAGTASAAWDEYVHLLGGVQNAYASIQDRMKGDFTGRFHQAYTALTGKPLRLGQRQIQHAELYAGYRDPATRERMVARRRAMIEQLRARTQGKYARGKVGDKMARMQQAEEIARQNQSSLLLPGGPETAKQQKEYERYFLGDSAEGQLQAIMPNVARAYRPLGGKIDLVKDRTFAGPFIHQQRAIKSFLASKRMAAALGTGCIAGDTLMVDARRGPLRVYDLWLSGASFLACAWSGISLAPILVSHVYCKGYEPMFRVTVEGGASITVTPGHRFLTAEGWAPLAALHVKDRIAMMPPDSTAPTPFMSIEPAALLDFDRAMAAMLPNLDRRLTAQPSNHIEAPPATWAALPPLAMIVGIEAIGPRLVFDCQVPIHANYAANGFINHNSGKTAIMMNAQTEGRARGVMKRGLYLVPAGVVEQFGPEFTRFVDPKAMTWAANPGAPQAQRLTEHSDPKTDAVVHSHQAFRDDMLHLLGQDWGVSDKEATKRFMGLDRKAAAKAMTDMWKKHKIAYDALFVDEGHGFLDRAGKPDSVLSRVAQAVSDITPYYMSSSADPIKNDVSELRSLMDKLVSDGTYSDPAAWNRKYGVNTTASAEALKREVAPYIYAGNIKVENHVRRRREVVPLAPKQQAQYDAVNAAYERVRAARLAGTVDVGAAKTLAPERFADAKPGDEERIAKSVTRNAGVLRDNRLQDVVDASDAGDNAKIQKLVAIAKEEDRTKKPLVVFAHRIDAVKKIAASLKDAGLSVDTYVGGDSQGSRMRKRRAFQEGKMQAIVLSDAGEAGLNLQRGHTLVQYDRPYTAKTHAQRNGRIDRLGQQHPDISLVDLQSDTPFEARAQERIDKKYALRSILTDPDGLLDDTGLADVLKQARAEAAGRQARQAKAVPDTPEEPAVSQPKKKAG